MLSLDEPIGLSGLSIFRDFNDRSLFYYLPESPQIATSGGVPSFELLIYRREAGDEGALGGGFLTMTADLHVAPGRVQNAEAELSRRFGVTARLSPLPVESGSVRVTLLDSSSSDEAKTGGFVEHIVAAGTPSLYGDQRAVFTSKLSQDGATLMQAALQDGGATPVVLVYELTYKGLLPAYECTIKVHFDQTYEYLRQRATFSSLMLQMDVDREMEELVKRGAIEISEIVYHTEDPEQQARRRQELQQLAKELATWSFFSPGLQPGKVLVENQRELFAPPPNFEMVAQRNQRAIQGALRGTAAVEGAPLTQGAGDDRQTRPSGSPTAAEGDPPRTQPDVQPPPGAGTLDAWERAGRPHATLQLKQIQQRERQDIVFHLQQVSAASRTISPQGQIRLLGGPGELAKHIKQISLDSDFFKKVQGTVTTTAPLQELGLSSMSVQVRYGQRDDGTSPKDMMDAPLRATGDQASFDWWVDKRGTTEIEYRVTLNHIPDAAIGASAIDEVSPWIKTTSRALDIDPREVGATIGIRVEAGAIDWALIKQVQATVHYEDASGGVKASRVVKLEQATPSHTVLVRPVREQKVRVAAKLFYADGSTDDVSVEQTGAGVALINQPADSVKTVTAILADPLGRYDKVTVQLAPGAGETARVLEMKGDLAKETWAFRPGDGGGRSYRYKATYFVAGAVREENWVSTEADQVILGDRADGVLSVNVVFLSDLRSAEMKALRLKLRYKNAPEWADPDMEKVFVAQDAAATASPTVWRVPMRKRTEGAYEYSLTWIRNDGTQVVVGPTETSSETLLLDPQRPEAAQ